MDRRRGAMPHTTDPEGRAVFRLVTDFGSQAPRPCRLVPGHEVYAALSVPFLPEPFGDHDRLTSPDDIYERHRARFSRQMTGMLAGLHRPGIWHAVDYQ